MPQLSRHLDTWMFLKLVSTMGFHINKQMVGFNSIVMMSCGTRKYMTPSTNARIER